VDVRLAEIASVIRSKNAGPYELTLDIIFRTPDTYRTVVDTGCLTPSLICDLYQLSEDDVLDFVHFEPAAAIKITLRRPRVAGDVGDTDVYGAQQHGPLLDLVINLPGR
jgi:hypothetical protein